MLLIADCVPSFYGPTHPETMINDKQTATNYLRDRRWNLYSRLVSQEYVDPYTGEKKTYPKQPE
jgi:hypothetical protein